MSDARAQKWTEQLAEALNSLNGNIPGLERALADQLRELDASKLRSLTPDQLQKLKEQLHAARGAGKKLPHEDPDALADEGDGENGQAGVNDGPGHPPLRLAKEPTNLGTEKTEGLDNEDFSRAALGDLAGTSEGQHQVDKNAEHRSATGGAGAAGSGPDAVWLQQSLPPEERERLRRFYQ
jgi:hypothetical protein